VPVVVYEKRAGFHPYEVVQAMEGRLVHHAMEWLTRQHQEALDRRRHAGAAEGTLEVADPCLDADPPVAPPPARPRAIEPAKKISANGQPNSPAE
jgi:hypothetical protein